MTRLIVAALALAGCGKPHGVELELNASGATFQQAVQEVAIEAFTRAHPHIAVNYAGGGSGKGRQDFVDGVVDFACTDAPFKPDAKPAAPFIYVPNVLGAISITYNLDVPRLQFSATTLARIFQGEIRHWNDAAIAAENPGVTLPALGITIARRADGSGTTENFTKYLAKASGGAWRLKAGSTIEWPADTQAGNGNGGVAQIVKQTRGAIGYVDLSDAKASEMKMAAVQNRAGTFVMPSVASVGAATEDLKVSDDLIFSALDSGAPTAYPITAQSWCMAYVQPKNPAKAAAVKSYLQFMVTDAGALLAEVDFVPPPPALQQKALAAIARIEVP